MKNLERRFLLVDVSVLPEVFLKVLKAKELLAAGSAKNVSAATKMAGLSRSAFYKYKDCIFDAENSKEVLTVNATLLDETGALQSLLAGISAAGASIVTINQATPENGAAQVAVSIRTGGMQVHAGGYAGAAEKTAHRGGHPPGRVKKQGFRKSPETKRGGRAPSRYRGRTMATIAILGFGTVGSGVLEVLRRNAASIAAARGPARHGKIHLRHPGLFRPTRTRRCSSTTST